VSKKLPIRILCKAIAWTLWPALVIACAGMLALGVARLAGYQTFTILSGSMEPTIATGDLVFDDRISVEDARVGDVITFREPGTSRLITHRLMHKRVAGRVTHMRTQGDANNAPERWNIPADGQVGRVAFRVPKAGYASAYLSERDTRLMLVVVPALLLGMLELARIWRPAPRGARRARPA
jgi:signal peptidase